MIVAWLPRDEVTIHDTWHTTGLAGSGSNDYSVTDAFVPEGHTFSPLLPGVRSEPLYRYRGFFFANLAAVSIGCARRMLDDLRALMAEKVLMPEGIAMKDDGRALLVLGESTAALRPPSCTRTRRSARSGRRSSPATTRPPSSAPHS